MKNLFLTFSMLSLLSTQTLAGINAKEGFYLGANVTAFAYKPPSYSSYSSVEWKLLNFTPTIRIMPTIGYRFSDYVAIEASYASIRDISNSGNGKYGPDHYQLYQFEGSGKFIYPFESGFSPYIKAGLSYVHQSAFNQPFVGAPVSIDRTVNEILPLAGMGISYNWNQHVETHIVYTQIFGRSVINNIEMLGFGMTYTF